MRLNSSGNLLVGKTASDIATTGVEIDGNLNKIQVTRDGGTSVFLNRLTSDGEMIILRKDGTNVGAIGAKNGDLVIHSTASGHEGLRFGNGAIVPVGSTGATTDNETNLGGATGRFSDLYLAGGVFLGGTGSANKLDDYEEGTWTPVFSSGTGGFNGTGLSVVSSAYRKIGDQVHLYASITITSGGNLSVGDSLLFTGQPFTPISPFTYRMGVGTTNQSVGSNAMAVGVIGSTSNTPGSMRLIITQVNGSVQTSAQTHFNIHYPTS